MGMNLPPSDRRAGLQPPRFGLGSLFFAVAVLGLMFAFIHYVGMYGSVIAIFFLLCVAAHVAGNAIGTRLREIGSAPVPGSTTESDFVSATRVSPADFAPATKLRERSSLGKPIVVVTALGIVAGGVGGAVALV